MKGNQDILFTPFMLAMLAFLVSLAVAFPTLIQAGSDPFYPNDNYSEANAIRAVRGMLEFGPTHHCGLGDIKYTHEFSDQGVFSEIPGPGPYVYTHYPPGSLWLLWFVLKFPGTSMLLCRFVMALVVSSAFAIFSYSFASIRGSQPTLMLIATYVAFPIFPSMTSSLYHHSHVYALFWLSMAVGYMATLSWRSRLTLSFLLGGAAGFITFDFVAVLLCAPVVGYLLSCGDRGGSSKETMLLLCSPTIGFVAAHFFHLLQVACHLGSIQAAIADIVDAALWRSSGKLIPTHSMETPTALYAHGVSAKLFALESSGISPLRALVAMNSALMQPDRLGSWGPLFVAVLMIRALVLVMLRKLRKPEIAAIMIAFAASYFWALTMPQHTLIHSAFICRQFILILVTFFVVQFCRVEATSKRGRNKDSVL